MKLDLSQTQPVVDQYYVLATSVPADREPRVLKQGETFAVFDAHGDINYLSHQYAGAMFNSGGEIPTSGELPEAGVFHRGTRYLSYLEFDLHADRRPLLLNSTLRDDNGLLKVDLTNTDLELPDVGFVKKGTICLHREKLLLDARCVETFSFHNYGPRDITFDASIKFAADFADIFEVRGLKRERRGKTFSPVMRKDELIMGYEGRDGVSRETRIHLDFPNFNFELWPGMSDFALLKGPITVPRRGQVEFQLSVLFQEEGEFLERVRYRTSASRVLADHTLGRSRYCRVLSSNEELNGWVNRSTDDLVMMSTVTDEGQIYPYAGIPWFCAPFGRDGLITALECLWVNPSLAKGVLIYLAQTQAVEHVALKDSSPGKIIHEARRGEMANLGEVPFGRYYGSVDSTPLFILLAGAYHKRSHDPETLSKIWPAVERSLNWLDRYGDIDGDGFIEYQRESPSGLRQQGWKDSHDSVFHADDSEAEGAIALCEVQGYAYAAFLEGAFLADVVGHSDWAKDLRHKAKLLKDQFDTSFWLEDLETFALALDGEKRACRVASSNAGQCLFTGIVKPERIAPLVRTLMRPESFCGWGIRTISSEAIRFNPMSYHNGSVWPHDSALIAWGLAKNSFKDEADKIFSGLFRADTYMELRRMPEVFCGFERRDGEAPTLYPHACSPQSWSAASVFLLLKALLGLEIDATKKQILFYYPSLPASVEWIKFEGLKVGDCEVNLHIQRYSNADIGIQILSRTGDVAIIVEK
jgi:glycogen debranching enzyme